MKIFLMHTGRLKLENPVLECEILTFPAPFILIQFIVVKFIMYPLH
jgi:hypothetical protein